MEIGLAEREVLIEEARALGATVQDPSRREQYAQLQAALETGAVSDDLGLLENLLALSLRTGRIRRLYGPEAETALLRLFQKTPRGSSIAQTLTQLNQALEQLKGQVIDGIAFTPRLPGTYGLSIETGEYRLNLEIQEEGIWLKDVGIEV